MVNKTLLAVLALTSLNIFAQSSEAPVNAKVEEEINPFAKIIKAGDNVNCKVYKETLNKEKIYMDVTGRIVRSNGSKTILSGTDPRSKRHALIKLDIRACVPEGMVINDEFKIEVQKPSKVAIDDFDNFTNEVVKVETKVATDNHSVESEKSPIKEATEYDEEIFVIDRPVTEKASEKVADKEDYAMGLEGLINKTIKAVKAVDEKGQGDLTKKIRKELAEKKKKDETLRIEKTAKTEKNEEKITDEPQPNVSVAEESSENSIKETKFEDKAEKKGILVFLKDLLFGRK